MNLPFANTRDLAAALRNDHFPALSVLPYNRFDVENTEFCWLSPTSEKQAFAHGKLICTSHSDWCRPGNFLCGFAVEKGLSGNAVPDNPSEKMEKTWFWNRVVERAGQPLADKINAAEQAAGEAMQIGISAGMLGTGGKWPRARYVIDGTELHEAELEKGDGVLAPFSAVDSLEGFATALRTFDGSASEWYWAVLIVGFECTAASSGPDDTATVAEALKAFAPWIRAGD